MYIERKFVVVLCYRACVIVVSAKNKMADEVAEKMKNVQTLMDKKNKIEEEIKELHGVLESVRILILFQDVFQDKLMLFSVVCRSTLAVFIKIVCCPVFGQNIFNARLFYEE